jgi:uncharacterized OB-fold protein
VQQPVDGVGMIYACTINRVPQADYKTEYAIGYVDYPGLRVFGHIRLNSRMPRIGDPVTLESAILKQGPDGEPLRGFRFVARE